jgi:tetratricopeptide (TPR) repeat protein
MTRTNPSPVAQPSLEDLMVRFLASRSDAASGSAVEPAGGEVEPYEVAAGFRVDPRAAWTDATDALPARPEQSKLPTEWASLVAQPAAAFAVAHAAGNFPQRVKDLQPLLASFDPAEMRPSGSQPPSQGLSGLRTWIIRETKKNQPVPALLAAGVARSIGEFDWAEELLNAAESLCEGELRAAWENERAALLWHRGRSEDALAVWNALAESPAVLFNRGMALLFLGKLTEARAALTRAVAVIPEESGWNALTRLYLAIAEIHG